MNESVWNVYQQHFRGSNMCFPTSHTYDETRLRLLCCSWQTTVASKRTSDASVFNRWFVLKSLSHTFVNGNTRQSFWACLGKENGILKTTADSHDTQWSLHTKIPGNSGKEVFTARIKTCLSRRPFTPDIIMKPTKTDKRSWFVQIDMHTAHQGSNLFQSNKQEHQKFLQEPIEINHASFTLFWHYLHVSCQKKH